MWLECYASITKMGIKSFFILVISISLSSAVCPQFPKASINSLAHIKILGSPKHFVPSSVYTVELEHSLSFTEFVLTCEAEKGEGGFQILNNTGSQFAENCVNTIVESNRLDKIIVRVLWTAPNAGCVNLKAAMKISGNWQATNKTICVLESGQKSLQLPPTCCTCDHAKYKIIFEGLWSPETHPKEFPSSLWLTHFSDVIGATHTPNFSMWAEGTKATYGFRQLAEFGVVREMETELRNASTQLRSIIKATGLWHPNLNGKTTAIFHVDPRRHLLSLASMFGPSPDWIVGLSALNLCRSNCSWLESQTINLYPYDAGTDNGITYMSINDPSDPQEKIYKITSMYPEDPRSPFYDPTGKPMLPLAKIYLTREKLVPKRCSDLTEAEILEQVSLSENTEDKDRPECRVTSYSTWSSCSVSCGKGIRMRSRKYLNSEKAKMLSCDRQLVSKEMCVAEQPSCLGDLNDDEVAPLVAPGECDVTAWSNWSDCSVTCGIGFIVRTRTFTAIESQVHKKCIHISTMEKEKCMLPPCILEEPKVPPVCQVTEWSEWSPCSVTCGQGLRKRIRFFKSSNTPKFCSAITPSSQTHACTLEKECILDPNELKRICSLEHVAGPCRGAFLKWAYNVHKQKCLPFYYGGCRGNKNRFNSLEECNKACSNAEDASDKNFNLSLRINDTPVNCVVSKWSNWSPCYPCTNGTKTKTRTIITNPKNGGRPCPSLSRTVTCDVPEDFCQ